MYPLANTVSWIWDTQKNVIVFEKSPAAGTEIHIEYKYEDTN